MPEMRFRIRWPDGRSESCYSPSLVIKEVFTPGESYPLGAFVDLCREALTIASERVRLRYGRPCALALGQLGTIEATARTQDPAGAVSVEAFEE